VVVSPARVPAGEAGPGSLTGPHRTQWAVHPNGSTCTASLRPQRVQNRGGSDGRRHESCPASDTG
jgi:hypothetical protein